MVLIELERKLNEDIKSFIQSIFEKYPKAKEYLKNDMAGTPERFTQTIIDMFKGYDIDEKRLEVLLNPTYSSKYTGMVVQKNVVAYSICPHHLMPIKYSFAIGYIPDKKVVGLSKLAHLCGFYTSRPSIQENLTYNIVEALERYLKPKGSGVVVIGRHDCILMGAGETKAPEFRYNCPTTKDNIYNITAELRGRMLGTGKDEFYAQIQDWLNNRGMI